MVEFNQVYCSTNKIFMITTHAEILFLAFNVLGIKYDS